jgi:hypothetical protein
MKKENQGSAGSFRPIRAIKKILRHLAIVTITLFPLAIYAQPLEDDVLGKMAAQDGKFASKAGLKVDRTIFATTAYNVISGFLGLLGIIFVILMIYAGYNWMTAAGDEKKVEKAKDTIQRAIIGLIITVAAYAITYFVFSALGDVATGGGMTAESKSRAQRVPGRKRSERTFFSFSGL